MINKIVTLKKTVIGYSNWIKPFSIEHFLANPKTRKYALEMISVERTVAKPFKVPMGAAVYVLHENNKGGFIGFTLERDIYIKHLTCDDIYKNIWWDIGTNFEDADAGRAAGEYEASLANTIADEMLADYRNQNEVMREGLSYRSTNYFSWLMNTDERVKNLSDAQQKVLYLAASQKAFRARRKFGTERKLDV